MKKQLLNFLPYQQKYIKDKAKFKIAMFARQTGKTFSSGAEIVNDCLEYEKQKLSTHWVILSRGERQSKNAMDKAVKPLIKGFYSLYKSMQTPEYIETSYKIEEATYNALEVKFPNGSLITALPANPDTARGFSANLLLDEFAFHKDSREIWQAVFPIISEDDLKLRVISTPNGKNNKFYELWTAPDEDWSKHRCDIYQAVEQGLKRNIEQLKKGLQDEDAWRQEFELEFMDEATVWFTFDLINKCEEQNAGKSSLYTNNPCYIGVDIARRKHLWVATVLERIGDVLWVREIKELQNASFYAQDQELIRLFNKYNVARMAMDQTGMGWKPVEDAQRMFGESRVMGILFNTASKQDLAVTAKQYFEDRKIRIPIYQPLRTDLHNIKKTVGPTGIPRFDGDTENGSHADRAWSLMLAISAGTEEYQPYDYIPIRNREKPNFRSIKGYL